MESKKILILLAVLISVGFTSSFIYWSKNVKPENTSLTDQKEGLSPLTSVCDGWTDVPGEISCQKAIEISLGRYAGKTEYVERVVLPGDEILAEVGIRPDSPVVLGNSPKELERIKVIINAKTSEIISVRPGRGL